MAHDSQWALQTVTNALHYAKRSLDGISNRMSLEGAVFKDTQKICVEADLFLWLDSQAYEAKLLSHKKRAVLPTTLSSEHPAPLS